ncbi:hypothetical protein [Gaetbulibacter saemankumensis]|uniref:hypothetical protein n=1 Tax=Gaetbulibacter saemankumensis TaxID=311208 RepID=UPI001FE091C3|nr:hypothetical protein [Gaetbulibacter saemankumensis]
MLEHANYHKEMYGDSFLEFISEHYGDQTLSHGENHDEHKKLPFKEHHHMLCQVNAVFILTSTLTSPLNCQSFTEIPLNFFYKESISLFEKPSVFQPPKFA